MQQMYQTARYDSQDAEACMFSNSKCDKPLQPLSSQFGDNEGGKNLPSQIAKLYQVADMHDWDTIALSIMWKATFSKKRSHQMM